MTLVEIKSLYKLRHSVFGRSLAAPTRQLSVPDGTIAGAIFVVALAALFLVFGQTFPLNEFRDILVTPFSAAEIVTGFARKALFPFAYELYSRNFYLAYVGLVSNGCGTNIPCINFWILVPLAASLALAYLIGRRLGIHGAILLAGLFYWIASPPLGLHLLWQAIVHDSLALLFTLAALLLYLGFTRTRATNRQIIACNLAVGLCVLAAVNSKEAAFPLPGLLVLFALVELGHKADLPRRLAALIVPVAYGAYYLVIYFARFVSDPVIIAYSVSGSMTGNFAVFAQHLGLSATGLTLTIMAFAIAVILGYVVLGLRARAALVALPARGALALAIAAALQFALVLRTKYPAPYYLSIPSLFELLSAAALMSALVYAASRAVDQAGAARRLGTVLAAAFALPFLALAAYHLARPVFYVPAMLRHSANFRAALPALRRELTPTKGVKYVVVSPNNRAWPMNLNYLFIGNPGAAYDLYGLWRLIDPGAAERITPGKHTTLVFQRGAACPTTFWDACIRFDGQMKLLGIEKRNGGSK